MGDWLWWELFPGRELGLLQESEQREGGDRCCVEGPSAHAQLTLKSISAVWPPLEMRDEVHSPQRGMEALCVWPVLPRLPHLSL